jgi:hypothetical protein
VLLIRKTIHIAIDVSLLHRSNRKRNEPWNVAKRTIENALQCLRCKSLRCYIGSAPPPPCRISTKAQRFRRYISLITSNIFIVSKVLLRSSYVILLRSLPKYKSRLPCRFRATSSNSRHVAGMSSEEAYSKANVHNPMSTPRGSSVTGLR